MSRGWIDLELFHMVIDLDPDSYGVNFSRRILPLLPAVGSAVNLFRYIVECLVKGLKNHVVTRMAIDLGHGARQADLHFSRCALGPDEEETYRLVSNHSWTRTVFVCKKFREYVSLRVLSDRNVAFFRGLEELWWKQHAYLRPEDRSVLEELACLADGVREQPFSDVVAEMYTTLRDRLLLP